MPTKFNHRKFYVKPEHRRSLGKFNIQTGMICTFKYKGAERDKRPLVFVMDTDEFVKKENKKISGINLNYLPISYLNKFFIRMLDKVGWEFDRYTKLPKVDLWDEENPGVRPTIIYKKIVKIFLLNRIDCWRSYNYDKITSVEHVNFNFNVKPLNELKDLLPKPGGRALFPKAKGTMKFKNPNLLFEWNEAKRYPEFEEMGKDGWVTYATRNGSTVNFSQIKTHLGNVNLDLSKLDKNKRKRFDKTFEKRIMEMSIAVKFGKNDYDLVAGNTRIAGCFAKNIDQKIWVVDLQPYYTKEEAKEKAEEESFRKNKK